MIKLKTTKKAIISSGKKIIKIGYCGVQNLLHHEEAFAYTCGSNGWNADIYNIDGVLICTGYRPFGDIEVNYSILQKYEEKAQNILYGDYTIDYNVKKEAVKKLLLDFIQEVTKND